MDPGTRIRTYGSFHGIAFTRHPPFGHLLPGGEKGTVAAAARLVGAALVNFQAVTPRKNGANFFSESPLLPHRHADEASLVVPRRED
jgi:hypothetical protein